MTRRHHEAAAAHQRLTAALVALATQGVRPRCGDPIAHELWLSDDREDRQTAARWCTGCPVLDLCGQAADAAGERFGVWGGKDRTTPTQGQATS